MKKRIVQTSPYHTASTVLTNALYGLIPELFNKKVIYDELYDVNHLENMDVDTNIIVIKSHNGDIDKIQKMFQDTYEVFFVCSERKERGYFLDAKYKLYPNAVFFDYDELNETDTNTLQNIIDCIYNKTKDVLKIDMNVERGKERIDNMNKLYEEIKNKPFEYHDEFYQIHGSHRNRSIQNQLGK
jgi:hypothetical protein